MVFHVADLNGRVDWASMFGNGNPVEIEIGCGKGRFLIHSAMTFPHINYIGIERARKYFRIMRDRAAKRELMNVRLLCDDAAYFVTWCVPDASITAYHVYFPDPWPKKRHRKRRLFKPDFVTQVERTLIGEGTIDIASDYEEYFQEIVGLLDAAPGLIRMEDLPERVRALGAGMTNFEVKYAAEGRPIFRAAYKKIRVRLHHGA